MLGSRPRLKCTVSIDGSRSLCNFGCAVARRCSCSMPPVSPLRPWPGYSKRTSTPCIPTSAISRGKALPPRADSAPSEPRRACPASRSRPSGSWPANRPQPGACRSAARAWPSCVSTSSGELCSVTRRPRRCERENRAAGRYRDAYGVLLDRAVGVRRIVPEVLGSAPPTLR